MAEDGTGLPASFEMVWGVRERPTKGPKRGLSLEQIVDAGVTVASAEGLGAVSMSRVAGELGTSAMSLYRYVASKDELLALMVDAAFGKAVEPFDPAGPWRTGLERWAWSELGAYRAHPWALRIPIQGAPITPNTLRFLELGLRCMGDTGLREDEKLSVILLLTSYTRAYATLSADIAGAVESGDATGLGAKASYGALIMKLTSAEEFPALHKVVEAGTFENNEDEDIDYDFVFGLTRLLDGVEALVRSRE